MILYIASDSVQTFKPKAFSKVCEHIMEHGTAQDILLMVQKSGEHQLRLVVEIPSFTGFSYIQTVVVWDFFHQQYHDIVSHKHSTSKITTLAASKIRTFHSMRSVADLAPEVPQLASCS